MNCVRAKVISITGDLITKSLSGQNVTVFISVLDYVSFPKFKPCCKHLRCIFISHGRCIMIVYVRKKLILPYNGKIWLVLFEKSPHRPTVLLTFKDRLWGLLLSDIILKQRLNRRNFNYLKALGHLVSSERKVSSDAFTVHFCTLWMAQCGKSVDIFIFLYI